MHLNKTTLKQWLYVGSNETSLFFNQRNFKYWESLHLHTISLVFSSGSVIAIIGMIAVWCIMRKKRCCREERGVSPSVQIAMPAAPQTTAALASPSAPPMTMASPAPLMLTSQAPPTDIELAILRIQEKERLRHLHQLHQQYQDGEQRHLEAPGPQQYTAAWLPELWMLMQ